MIFNKKVSVVVPSRDRLELLTIAIESISKQTYKNIEIIIVDDCSKIALSSSLDIKANDNIRIIRNIVEQGGAYSRKLGSELSTGDYVCFLDDDDYFFENKIYDLVEFMESNNDADAVFGNVIKKSINDSVRNKYISDHSKIKSIKALPCLHTNGSLVRKSVLEKVNFYPSLRKFQDTQFHIELIKKFNVYYLNVNVAMWVDKHEGKQITDMNNDLHKIKTVECFYELLQYLKSKEMLSLSDEFFLSNTMLKFIVRYKHLIVPSEFIKTVHPLILTLYPFYSIYYFLNH